ncbi:MAG: hypothetical protein Q9177_005565 [Variospora cf. flavescens]
MNVPYVCLRCRQQVIRQRQCLRSIGFVSLNQANRTSETTFPQHRTPSPNHGPSGSKTNDAVERGALPVKRSKSKTRPPLSGTDSMLETLFSSQQEKQRHSTLGESSRTQGNHNRDEPTNEKDARHSHQYSARTTSTSLTQSDRAGRATVQLGRPEEQLAETVSKTALITEGLRGPHGGEENEPFLPKQKHHERRRDIDVQARRVTTIIKYIERAVHRYDVAQVGIQWQKFQQTLAQVELDQQSEEAIYTHFLAAYCALSRQEQAVTVWNHMVDTNIMPNERHWNAMLKGCFKAQDVTSLQEVWSNMIASGMKPDTVLWTTYIHGLIMCGKWQRGLQLLDELGANWTAARKRQSTPKDIASAATEEQPLSTEYDPSKPSLAPVQAALTGLTAIQHHELCPPILDWAKSHSLALTTEIFNILLRPAVRSGDPKQVARIFSLMNTNACAADEVTYMILLNGHISSTNSNFALLSSKEQQDSILRILDDMTANGISMDRRTYSSILQGLLRSQPNDNEAPSIYNGNKNNAAQAILQHMSRNNVTPDSYMYHILVIHYFSLSPPDLAAIDNLWARIKVERPSLQSIFYEKMVEGYAKVGAVEKMLFFLRKIAREGKSPRWRCLVDVLNTLIAEGEWGLLGELVADVEDTREGLMRYADGNIPGMWKGEFWETVRRVRGRI